MYCILMKDEIGYIDSYKIGHDIKTYSTEEDAQKEIDEMIKKEKELYGDLVTRYSVAIYKEF